jgi:sigma-E factor negative regulatory protein RseC
MEEEGRIIKVEENLAQVEVERKSACRACGLCSLRRGNTMIAEADNSIGAKVGERVRIEIPSSIILKGALLFYILPLVALILGMALGIKITKHQTGGLILGLSFFTLSYILAWLYNKKRRAQNICRSRITMIIN